MPDKGMHCQSAGIHRVSERTLEHKTYPHEPTFSKNQSQRVDVFRQRALGIIARKIVASTRCAPRVVMNLAVIPYHFERT